MANYKTTSLAEDDYGAIIRAIREGFMLDGVHVEPNERVAAVLTVEANLGLRVGDVLRLRLNDIIRDGNRYRFDIVEEKTGKVRTFTVPHEMYSYLCDYAISHNLPRTAHLFSVTERAIQKHLQKAVTYLGLSRISTHSFRKFFGTRIYENNGHDIVLVQRIFQHSTTAVTQRYIGVQQKNIEDALTKNVIIV